MLNSHPWQNEKTNVIHHVLKVSLAGFGIPTNQHIPAANFPGCGTPTEAGHWPLVKADKILEVGPDDPRSPQVVVGINQVIPERLLLSLAHHSNCQRTETADRPFQGGVVYIKNLPV